MNKKKLVNKHISSIKGKPSPLTVILFILLLIYVIGLFIPFIWSFIVSFMEYSDYRKIYVKSNDTIKNVSLLFGPTFNNFIKAWNTLPKTSGSSTYQLYEYFLNAILYAVGCATSITLASLIVGYATARFKFKLSGIIYNFVIVAITIPIIGSTASELAVLRFLNIDDTIFSMFILRFNFLTLYYMMFYAQFSTISKEYSEAAKIDGANNFKVMTRIIIPQAKPLIVTVFILNFVSYWNDFEIPILYIPSHPTVSYRIYEYLTVFQSGAKNVETPTQIAATFIMCLPIILVFIFANKKMRLDVSMGGIKG